MLLYEGAIRVPFLLWRPGPRPRRARRRGDRARSSTSRRRPRPRGRSRSRRYRRRGACVPLHRGARAGAAASGLLRRRCCRKLYMNWAPLRALRDGRYKLIDAPRPELYDLAATPASQRNLYAERPQTARALQTALDRVAGGEGRDERGAPSTARRSRSWRPSAISAPARSPAARRHEPGRPEETSSRSSTACAAPTAPCATSGSATRCRSCARSWPRTRRTPLPRWSWAAPTWCRGQTPRRDPPTSGATSSCVPTSSYAHLWLAICHVRRGEQDASLREADAALALDPRFSDARVLKAGDPGVARPARGGRPRSPRRPSRRTRPSR